MNGPDRRAVGYGRARRQTRGKWRVRYTENELCVMTAGRVIIESDGGTRESFAAGDAFVVPAGFSGTWEVVEDCTKIYGIFEART